MSDESASKATKTWLWTNWPRPERTYKTRPQREEKNATVQISTESKSTSSFERDQRSRSSETTVLRSYHWPSPQDKVGVVETRESGWVGIVKTEASRRGAARALSRNGDMSRT